MEIKLAAIAMYILSSSIRRIALLLNVGKSSVHYWIERFKDLSNLTGKRRSKSS